MALRKEGSLFFMLMVDIAFFKTYIYVALLDGFCYNQRIELILICLKENIDNEEKNFIHLFDACYMADG